MNYPTQEQIKEFWEWCGFTYRDEYPDGRGQWGRTKYPDGHEISNLKFSIRPNPPIDLNNLFKYAVPKLFSEGKYLHLVAHSQTRFDAKIEDAFGRHEDIFSNSDDPAIALFWAIWGIIQCSIKSRKE